MTEKADSELNLLQFYGICLPPVVSVNTDTVRVHKQSVDLLRDHSTWLLDQFVPADVGGDGNCLFRLDALALSVIATATWLAGWLGGWLSVTAGIVSKRLNVSENFFDHLIAPS